MSTYRYSGTVRIRVTYVDTTPDTVAYPNGRYRCFLSTKDDGEYVHVGAPRSLEHAVDSPEAFDAAAHAALSFVGEGISQHADTTESGWHIRRTP